MDYEIGVVTSDDKRFAMLYTVIPSPHDIDVFVSSFDTVKNVTLSKYNVDTGYWQGVDLVGNSDNIGVC